jgi:TP901-1 family phage major tail protein
MAAQRGLDFLLRGTGAGLTGTVNTTTEVWTTTTHGWSTGQPVEISSSGALPTSTPQVAGKTIYFINVQSPTTFTMHAGMSAALAGTSPINFSTIGSGTLTISPIVTLAGMRSTAFALNNAPVDITNKDSAGWRTLLAAAGVQSFTITASGAFTSSTIEEIFRAAAFARTSNVSYLFFGNGDTLTASFFIANYQRDGAFNNEETYSMTLENSGAPTYTAAS